MLKDKKILFVVPDLKSGGAERVVSILSSELADKDYLVSLLVFNKSDSKYLMSEKVSTIYLEYDYNTSNNIFINVLNVFNYKTFISVRKFLKKGSYDIIIPFLEVSIFISMFSNYFFNNKFIVTVRNNLNRKPRNFLYACLYKLIRCSQNIAFNYSDAIFLQNDEQRTFLKEKNQKKVFVVPNPLDERMFIPETREFHEVKKLITAGRLSEEKNHKMLIDAFYLIKNKCPHITLEIYGEGPLENELQNQINELGLEDRIFLRGRTDAIELIYRNADLFVFPSNSEGLPNALLEAMASGLPCISTNCPTGPSDAIDNMENGILVPVGSAIDMANAIELLVNDITLSNKLAKNANKTALERFEKNVVIDKFIFELENKLYKND